MTAPVAPAPAAPAAAPAAPEPQQNVQATPPAQVDAPQPTPRVQKPHTPLASRQQAQAAAREQAKQVLSQAAAAAPKAPEGVTPGLSPAVQATEASSATPTSPLAIPQGRKVPVDPNHPLLGGRRLDGISVQTEQEEQFVRGLMNSTGARKAELDAAKARIAQLENERLVFQQQAVQQEAIQDLRSQWESTPQYQAAVAKYAEIQKQFGDEAALQFWRGAQADFVQHAQATVEERLQEAQYESYERMAQGWVGDTYQSLGDWLPEGIRALPHFNIMYDKAIKAFNAELELGNLDPHGLLDADGMRREFVPFFQARLAADQGVRDLLQRAQRMQQEESQRAQQAAQLSAQQQEALKKQIIDEYVKNEAQKRAAMPPHPLGTVAAASRSRGYEEASEPNASPSASPRQARQAARQFAREAARKYFGG